MLKNGLVRIIIKCIANFVLRVAYGSTVRTLLYCNRNIGTQLLLSVRQRYEEFH